VDRSSFGPDIGSSVNPPLRRRLLSRALYIYGRPGARETRGRIISAAIPGVSSRAAARFHCCADDGGNGGSSGGSGGFVPSRLLHRSLRPPRLRASLLAEHEAAATRDGLN